MGYKEKITCVYLIRCLPTGCCYVGSTSNKNERIAAHKRLLSAGKHHAPYLQNSWVKYGEDQFEFSVIDVFSGDDGEKKEWLKTFEDKWIAQLKPAFNVLDAAYSALGFKHPRESVDRRAALQRGKKRDPELVERIAEKRRGQKMPRDAVERVAAANRGRIKSPEEIQKLKLALTGKKKSAEHVAKIQAARAGFKHSDATKEKNRIASTGRKHSPETRALMSERIREAFKQKRIEASNGV